MICKATNLITKAFDEHGVKYRVDEFEEVSLVAAGFDIDGGPGVIVRFISRDDDNDVAVRVYRLVHKVPMSKRTAVMEACNKLNEKIRHTKFYLSSDSDVNVEADLLVSTDEDSLGENCFELFLRFMRALNEEYHVLAEVLYSSSDRGEYSSLDVLKAIQELQNKPLIISDEEAS